MQSGANGYDFGQFDLLVDEGCSNSEEVGEGGVVSQDNDGLECPTHIQTLYIYKMATVHTEKGKERFST